MNELELNKENTQEDVENVSWENQELPEEVFIGNLAGEETKYRKSDGTIGKKEALIGGLAASIATAIAGFAGGVYYERRQRNAMHKTLDELVTALETKNEESADAINLIDSMRGDITNALNSAKLGTKEFMKWNDLFNRFIDVTARDACKEASMVILDEMEKQEEKQK